MQLSDSITIPTKARTGFRGENTQLDHIPGTDGWPLFGNTFHFTNRLYDFSAEQRERYGQVFRNNAFFMRFLTFASAEGAEFVMRDEARNFSSKLGLASFVEKLFPNCLPLMDGAELKHYRSAVQSVFRGPALDGLVQRLQPVVARVVDSWKTDRTVKLFPELKRLTSATAVSLLCGLDAERDHEFVRQRYAEIDVGFAALVPRAVPGLALWRALRARAELRDFFLTLIPARRQSHANDFLTVLCRTTDERGALLTDDAVIDHLLPFLRAFSDSTTGSLSVAVHHLARHPDWQERMREQSRDLGAGPLSSEQLNGMRDHELFFLESLRLFPTTPLMIRRSVRECEFAGHVIPAGTEVMVDLGYLHRSPLYWTDSLRFDPLRFAPPRAEHKRQKYQWVPFGVGAHNCLGQFLAMPFAKYVLHQLLLRYRVELVDQRPFQLTLLPATYPKGGLPLRLRALS